MSFKGVTDADLDLKIKTMNLFWKLGYIVRPEINLYYISSGQKTPETITDIDLFAVKIRPLNDIKIIIASAKTGRTVKDAYEILYLAGVQKFLQADKAYYIRGKIIPDRLKYISSKLGVQIIRSDEMDILMKRYANKSDIIDLNIYTLIHNKFNELKNKNKDIYNIITSDFWTELNHISLITLLECFIRLNTLNLEEEDELIFNIYLISLFTLNMNILLTKICTELGSNVKNQSITILMGGEENRLMNKNRVGAFKKFLKSISESDEIQNYSSYIADDQLNLIYQNDLLELFSQLWEFYQYMHFIPKIFDWIFFQYLISNKELKRNELDLFIKKEIYSEPSIIFKLINIILNFFEKISSKPINFFKSKLNL